MRTSLTDGAGPFDSRRAAASISLRVGLLTPTSINGYLGVAYVAASGDPADGFCELSYLVSIE